MENQEITKLLNVSEGPCVSITLPMHRLSPERIKDSAIVKHAVAEVENYLFRNYPSSDKEVETLIHNIDSIVEKIDYTHSREGIGIYVSPQTATLIKFPFPVVEKVKVNGSFYCSDLLYLKTAIIDYCVLSISKKHIHLFTATGEDLTEIKNKEFPITYYDNYEYTRSSRGTSFGNNSLKAFEKDKTILNEIRLIDLLRKADQLIDKYINASFPIIIAGGKKEIADFVQVTKHKKRIIGKVAGNYNFNGDLMLASHAWKEVQHHIENQNAKLLYRLHELLGSKMAAIGLEEAWKAAHEGKGLELIIEKDFERHAFISPDGLELKYQKPFGRKKYTYVRDAAELLIKQVRDKGGKIVFVDNGDMADFNGIALKLRYNTATTAPVKRAKQLIKMAV